MGKQHNRSHRRDKRRNSRNSRRSRKSGGAGAADYAIQQYGNMGQQQAAGVSTGNVIRMNGGNDLIGTPMETPMGTPTGTPDKIIADPNNASSVIGGSGLVEIAVPAVLLYASSKLKKRQPTNQYMSNKSRQILHWRKKARGTRRK